MCTERKYSQLHHVFRADDDVAFSYMPEDAGGSDKKVMLNTVMVGDEKERWDFQKYLRETSSACERIYLDHHRL